MAVVVLRAFTATGGGNLSGRIVRTLYGDLVRPPEDPSRDGTSDGSVSVWGLASVLWRMEAPVTASSPGSTTYAVGAYVHVTGPDATTDDDTDRDDYTVTTTKLEADESRSGTWSFSAEVELCWEVVKPSPPSGTGAGGYYPDPPHGTTGRVFLRRKNGGSWTITASMGAATATRTGTFGSAAELPYPDGITLAVECDAESVASGGGLSISASTTGSWRGSAIGDDISVSGVHGSASATAAGGCAVTATAADDPIEDSATSTSTMTLAVHADWTLDAQLRAMEATYPDSVTLSYERAGATVDVTAASGSYSDTRTYRSESSAVTTTDDSDSYSHPSNFGPISIALKPASASALSEPTTDLDLLMKDRAMNALSIDVPTTTADLTGTDSALAGTPWGVQRDWTGTALGWQPLMGWRYLEVVVAETGGAGSGAAVTVKIGSKEWTKDRSGTALTAPGSGSSATWVLDLCSPTNQSATTDATDTTYPYDEDWSDVGGDEDDRYRTGEGAYSGLMRAVDMTVEVGSARTFTLTSVKGLRDGADAVLCTNLPPHRSWVQQRPDTIVSEADTTTEHRVRQSFMVDLEGRLLAAEWSDTEWDKTTGGVSGVVTHTLYERSIEWLYDRVTAAALCPGWAATISAPVVGTGLTVYYNREREMHSLLGGGYWWEAPTVSFPAGRWRSGIDREMVDTGGTAQTLVWQGGFTRLLALPGNVGDVWEHADADDEGPTIIKAAKVLRCQAVGLSLDSAGLSSSGDALEMTQAGVSRGTGTTDADGYAQTGSSYGRGAGATPVLDIEGQTSSAYSSDARKRLHLRAKVGEEAEGVSVDTGQTGRTAVVYTESGTIRLSLMLDATGDLWETRDSGITGTGAVVRYSRSDPSMRIWVAYVAGGGAVELVSTDNEGRTWSVPTTIISAGTRPAMDVYPTGWLLAAWYDAGAIKYRWVDREGNIIRTTTTAVASGAADGPIGVSYDDSAARWYILYRTTGGALETVYSDDGINWT